MDEGSRGERGLLLVSALVWGTWGLVSSSSKPGDLATIPQNDPLISASPVGSERVLKHGLSEAGAERDPAGLNLDV